LSFNNKKPNVEVVLPAGGSPIEQPTDPKVYKQSLKTRINNLKLQQRDTQGTIKALEKELNKISKPVVKKSTSKSVNVVKKGKNGKRGRGPNSSKK
jgi:hypothetical protein